MNIAVGKITDAVAKITAITSGDKIIPGILLRVSNDPKPELAVCYTDGHKAIVEYLDVELDDTDKTGDFVVDYTMFTRALQNCQPSGIIAVDTVSITHKDDRTLQVSAEQKMITRDDDGNTKGKLYINGETVEENFIDESAKASTCKYNNIDICEREVEVPKDEYYVMGDNRGNSKDSRIIGTVEKESIKGITSVVIFPFNRFGSVK